METNNTFSVQRLILLGKQFWIIYKKMIAIMLPGFAGILFIVLILLQSMGNFQNWENHDYMGIFTFLFLTWGFIIAGYSYPGFRNKEKSMAYLMLPASASEKFIFEFLTRIVVFIFLMPLFFWVVANLEGLVVHSFVSDFEHYKFSFAETWSEINYQLHYDGWNKFGMVQGCIFVFIAAFTGASYFSKLPVLKTMFVFSILVAGYALFTFLLVKGLNLRDFHPENDRILFIKNWHDTIAPLAIGLTVINMCLLAIAFFRLKEKEA